VFFRLGYIWGLLLVVVISAIKYIAQALAFGRCIYIRLFIIVAYIAFNRLAFSWSCCLLLGWSFCYALPVEQYQSGLLYLLGASALCQFNLYSFY
jgi:hypothetical protein